ncbi:MAG: hypothetical protein KH423_07395 [Actinomycetaceae bacterium]|nr:hypothetical protein [Actinomycetaceae bacterium]
MEEHVKYPGNLEQRFGKPSAQWERMVAGKLYLADDLYMHKVRETTLQIQQLYNSLPVNRREEAKRLAPELFGHHPHSATVVQPVYVDYGVNIFLSEGTFINSGAILFDVAPIHIGKKC